MADNNVIKFRRIQKKPAKTAQPKPQSSNAARTGGLSGGQLSVVAWVLIIIVAVAVVALQQAGLLGG
jgi:hypothetical protein